MRRQFTQFKRGFAMIEGLVAALIMATCVAAIMGTFSFSNNMTSLAMDTGVAYNLARQTIETVKETGFTNTAEITAASPSITYYNGSMASVASANLARYKVTLTVVSSATIAGSNPVQPATTALRTVTVIVTLSATGKQVSRIDSYLSSNGT